MAFDGPWKVDRNENYDKFLEKMGISMQKRKLIAHDNMKITIKQTDNVMTVHQSSSFRTVEIEFQFGINFMYILDIGTELTGTWNMVRNKLVGDFKRLDNGNELSIVLEIVGGELIKSYRYEGVEAKRIFRRP